jgi:Putative DNA-binding domain
MGVEMGSGTLAGLLASLSAIDGEVFIRAAVRTGSHAVWHVDAVVAPPAKPPGWQPQLWEYDEATFIAGQASSTALAAALDPGDAQVLFLGGYDLTFPVLHEQLPWQHKPSRARYDSVVLPWPTRINEPWIQNRPGGEQLPQGYVIGDDCPSFPSYEAAFRAFFYGDFAGAPGGQLPSSFGVVRVVDSRAWLDKVRITPATLQVHVAGSDVAGARVELNSPTYRTHARVTESGQVSLPLPDGLPPGVWLYLSRKREWLDYRAIGEFRAPAELAHAGVEVEIAEDPGSEIQALLAQGEGLQVEFKRQLPENADESKRTVFKTVAAFANGHGGSIVFGVEKDEATVCGLEGIDLIAARDRLTQLARSIVTPAPDVEVQPYQHDGKTLLVLTVGRGSDPPYGITLPGKKDKPVEFYIRRDATTFPARPDEIRNAVLAASPPPAAIPPWGY